MSIKPNNWLFGLLAIATGFFGAMLVGAWFGIGQ